jgi:hypothetical protein
MSHIEEYYNKWLDENAGKDKDRELLHTHPRWRFQPTIEAFIYLENALCKDFDDKLSAKVYENAMLKKDVLALKSDVETLKKALADTLAALATK